MSELDRLREELDKMRRICDELRAENLRKEETIRELQLRTSTRKYAYDAVIGEDGGKIYRREMDTGILMAKRAGALERYRIEYENRAGTSNRITSNQSVEGYDEIDALK